MIAPRRSVDHLVIGGGPAGAMAAIKLADAGCQVMLVEKEAGPHNKVCGEFLSEEAIRYLLGISVFPADLGAAPVRSVRLLSGSRIAESVLPFQALSLSRRTLDTAMLARASAAGCEVQRGFAVEKLAPHKSGWLAQLNNGQSVTAQTVFLASGKHDLRGWNRPAGKQSDLVGFKLHWRLDGAQSAALRESTELFLFPGGYGGLILVETKTANLCLVVRRAKLRKHRGWNDLLAAILSGNRDLRQRLSGAEPLSQRPLAISPIPYGYINTRSDGLWRIGDQAAVIPSFTGDGISIALHSAWLAAEMYLNSRSSDEYMRILHRQLRQRMRLAICLSRVMVTAPGRIAAPFVLSPVPGAMRLMAAATRLPQSALLHGNHALASSGSPLSQPAPSSSRHATGI